MKRGTKANHEAEEITSVEKQRKKHNKTPDRHYIAAEPLLCSAPVSQCYSSGTDQRCGLYGSPAPHDTGGMGAGMGRLPPCPVRIWSSDPVQPCSEYRKEKVCLPVKKEAHLCL